MLAVRILICRYRKPMAALSPMKKIDVLAFIFVLDVTYIVLYEHHIVHFEFNQECDCTTEIMHCVDIYSRRVHILGWKIDL